MKLKKKSKQPMKVNLQIEDKSQTTAKLKVERPQMQFVSYHLSHVFFIPPEIRQFSFFINWTIEETEDSFFFFLFVRII